MTGLSAKLLLVYQEPNGSGPTVVLPLTVQPGG
jgi:hypothetical protein